MHPNLQKLSNSAQVLEETCPRLFELDRLSTKIDDEGEAIHFDFGHSVGRLVQDYLITGETSAAIFKEFLRYPRALIQDDLDKEATEAQHKKNFWFAINALENFVKFRLENLADYSIAIFNGKPAVELGFTIDCGDGFTYRGKLDALLVTKGGNYACLEIKTTGARALHPAMYRNSGQGIGYSAVVDTIARALGLEERPSFPVFYPVYQTHKMEWTEFRFMKSRTSHAQWIRHLLRTIQHVAEYAEDGFFPMHGQNCFHFNRECKFFEQCEMQNKYLVGPEENIPVKEDNPEDYPFRFTLSELIEAQLARVG